MKLATLTASAAALAIVAAASAGVAPTTFSVNSLTAGAFTEDFTIDSYAFGSVDFIDSVPNDGLPGFFHIEISSGESNRVGFDYEVVLNYAAYDIGFFNPGGTHSITLDGIYTDGSIIDVFVKDSMGNSIGSVVTDGNSIFWDVSVDDVLGAIGAGEDLPITIQFAIPGPGAIALLGLAGLAGGRRRRA